MIQNLKEKYIFDVVHTHLYAWKEAFRGILSDSLLNELEIGDFISSWKYIMDEDDRTNLIYVTELDRAVGFVAFGPSQEITASFNYEIHGIYVHPDHWGQRIGSQLMTEALHNLKTEDDCRGVFLWVMAGNARSRQFYEKLGFEVTEETRTSARYEEEFEEIKYTYLTNNYDG